MVTPLFITFFRRLFVLFAIFTASHITKAQQWGTFSGRVTDVKTGAPLVGVRVSTPEGGSAVLTAGDGSYTIAVPPGVSLLQFNYPGYEMFELSLGEGSATGILLEPQHFSRRQLVNRGYGHMPSGQLTSATAVLTDTAFNIGNINDVRMLWRGKLAGVGIYNQGDNPNGTAQMRIRGLTTTDKAVVPLVVIDGVIGASLDNLDPSDIESVQVLKDGSAAAIYGIRASHGVLLVTTKQGKRNSGVHADYTGYVAAASVARFLPSMNREDFIAVGGADLGSETIWQEEVSRTGISHTHHLAISGGADNTVYRASANFRDINGVLKYSGFDQINVRAGLKQFALNDRLKVSFNLSLTERESNFSFNEALRYAVVSNPTSPIRFDNGNYYQAILFDNYNPMALLELNTNEGKRKLLNFNTQVDYRLTDRLVVSANYGQQNGNQLNAEYYSRQSFFRGFQHEGLARRYFSDSKFSLFESWAAYTHTYDQAVLDITAGYTFQQEEFEDIAIAVGGFPNDNLQYYNLENGAGLIPGGLNSNVWAANRTVGFFTRVSAKLDKGISLNASLRRDGSTKLGEENKWGFFPSVGAGVDINRFLALEKLDLLRFRIGYGVTGGLPVEAGLSKSRYVYSLSGNIYQQREANPSLGNEVKKEINAGIDIGFGRKLTGSLDVYQRKIEDIIVEVNPENPLRENSFRNAAGLRTRGLELALAYQNQLGPVSWWSRGALSTCKTTLEQYPIAQAQRADLGAPGQGSMRLIRTAVGEEIGQFWGTVFSGEVDDNGRPVMKDVNGDGQLLPDQGSALHEAGDFTALGSGLPKLELGWTNHFSYKNWDANVFFWGIFGHSKVNTFRVFYEPINLGAINSFNRVITEKAIEDLTMAWFSSLYVEKAGFLSLDNITLGYNISVQNSRTFRQVRVSITGQNVFTVTNYTGLYAEPTLEDYSSADNGAYAYSSSPDVLSPGIDRRNSYFDTRTWLLGLSVGF